MPLEDRKFSMDERVITPFLWVVTPLLVMFALHDLVLKPYLKPTVAMLTAYGFMVAAIPIYCAVTGRSIASTFGSEFRAASFFSYSARTVVSGSAADAKAAMIVSRMSALFTLSCSCDASRNANLLRWF